LVYCLRQRGYVIVVCLSVSLFVCLLATLRKNFRTDLHEISGERWQETNEQMVKFCWRSESQMQSESQIRNLDPDPLRHTSTTCLGGGLHCPSASSLFSCVCNLHCTCAICVLLRQGGYAVSVLWRINVIILLYPYNSKVRVKFAALTPAGSAGSSGLA